MNKSQYTVNPIAAHETYALLKHVHYAGRIPSISFAFGLYVAGCLVGAVTYGTPASSTLRAGIAGAEFESCVLELNRLVLIDNKKNEASFLVSSSLKLLPKPSLVVSYADTGAGHVGFVYQACNFIYTGLSAKRTDWKIKGMEGLHGQTISDMSRGHENRAQFMREKFGDDFYLEERSRKHRYVFLCGNKTQKKQMLSALKYPVEPYPKGDTARHAPRSTVITQMVLI